MRVPAQNLIGEEGEGFRYILDGMNAERILIAAECIGDGRCSWRMPRNAPASARFWACDRRESGRPVPHSQAYANVEAASLMVQKAASFFDRGEPCGAEANLAKLWRPTPRGRRPTSPSRPSGLRLDAGYDVERKFRETRLYQVAPSPEPHPLYVASTSSASRGPSDPERGVSDPRLKERGHPPDSGA